MPLGKVISELLRKEIAWRMSCNALCFSAIIWGKIFSCWWTGWMKWARTSSSTTRTWGTLVNSSNRNIRWVWLSGEFSSHPSLGANASGVSFRIVGKALAANLMTLSCLKNILLYAYLFTPRTWNPWLTESRLVGSECSAKVIQIGDRLLRKSEAEESQCHSSFLL